MDTSCIDDMLIVELSRELMWIGKPFVGRIDPYRREAFCWWDRRGFHDGNRVLSWIGKPFVGGRDPERRETFCW